MSVILMPHGSPYKQLTTNFNEGEWVCKCCGLVLVEPLLYSKLQVMRDMAGIAINITPHGGCRCLTQNALSKGAWNSQHLIFQHQSRPCRAADIYIEGWSVEEVAVLAETQNFAGLGRYFRDGFVHVDVRPRGRWREDFR